LAANKLTALLLLSCPDNIGLVSRISHFIFERGGNILDLDEHVEQDDRRFSLRIAWDMSNFSISPADLDAAFTPLAREFNARWNISFLEKRQKVALFVSRHDHCLQEILWRHSIGEYAVDIPLVISNHPDLKPLAEHHSIPFYVFPITADNKQQQEAEELKLLKEYDIDTIVLARYMQILSAQFIQEYPDNIINIHHSFLPAFIGGDPYKQAHQRGVKIIGATSHYVTEDLDTGPIIEQDVIQISHRDTVSDLKRKGRDLERLVLARALQFHTEYRVLVCGSKTIVFQ
jgi:formyltetrahydrofolate deformylase